MTNSSALFLAIGIILLGARVAGSIARRMQQPRVLGELLIGVVMGPTLLNLLHLPVFGLNPAALIVPIQALADLGVLVLMFTVGLEVNLPDLAKVGRVGIVAGVSGSMLPVALALPVVILFGYSWQPALFAGVTLAATSVSISAQVLLELGVLRTKVGNALLATALIDDVIAILLVSLSVAISAPAGGFMPGDLIGIIVRMALYIGGAFLISWYVLPHVIGWVAARPMLAQSYGVPAVALLVALLFGWSAEYLGGIAAISGAFIAGVGMSRAHEMSKHAIEQAASNLAYAFLVPIFFVSVGLQADLSHFPLAALPLAVALLLIAVLSKVAGCGFGAYRAGFNRREALQLGTCMISRGEVGLIILSLALSRGIFKAADPLFAALFAVILLTTLLTPLLVRRVFEPPRPPRPVTKTA